MPKNAQHDFNHGMQQFEVKNNFRTIAFIVQNAPESTTIHKKVS